MTESINIGEADRDRRFVVIAFYCAHVNLSCKMIKYCCFVTEALRFLFYNTMVCLLFCSLKNNY